MRQRSTRRVSGRSSAAARESHREPAAGTRLRRRPQYTAPRRRDHAARGLRHRPARMHGAHSSPPPCSESTMMPLHVACLLTPLSRDVICPHRCTPKTLSRRRRRSPAPTSFEAREFKAADGGVLPLPPAQAARLRRRRHRSIRWCCSCTAPASAATTTRGSSSTAAATWPTKRCAAATRRSSSSRSARRSKKWVEVPWDGKEHAMPAEPSEPMQLVFELLAALQKEFPIDADAHLRRRPLDGRLRRRGTFCSASRSCSPRPSRSAAAAIPAYADGVQVDARLGVPRRRRSRSSRSTARAT